MHFGGKHSINGDGLQVNSNQFKHTRNNGRLKIVKSAGTLLCCNSTHMCEYPGSNLSSRAEHVLNRNEGEGCKKN